MMMTRSKSCTMMPNKMIEKNVIPLPLQIITRSKSRTLTNKNIDSLEIDFDEASREWRKNKKYHGNGMFSYKKM
jgi:hypothetical protein